MEGTTTNRRRRESYRLQRERLTEDVLRSLDLAEEAILVDPYHRHRRDDRPDGTTVDRNEPGLFVAYLVSELEQTVEFVEFIVLYRRPPLT